MFIITTRFVVAIVQAFEYLYRAWIVSNPLHILKDPRIQTDTAFLTKEQHKTKLCARFHILQH